MDTDYCFMLVQVLTLVFVYFVYFDEMLPEGTEWTLYVTGLIVAVFMAPFYQEITCIHNA